MAERDASPLEHVSLLIKVGHNAVELAHTLSLHGLVHFVQEVAARVDPGLASGCLGLVALDLGIQLAVTLGVREIHVRLFHEGRNFFELDVGVVLMVLDDTAEDLSQMAVQVAGDGALVVAS